MRGFVLPASRVPVALSHARLTTERALPVIEVIDPRAHLLKVGPQGGHFRLIVASTLQGLQPVSPSEDDQQIVSPALQLKVALLAPRVPVSEQVQPLRSVEELSGQ